jgi:hypothetical protein
VSYFIVHPANTDEQIFVPNGFNKPIDVRFRGSEMFIVDFGDFLSRVHNVANSGDAPVVQGVSAPPVRGARPNGCVTYSRA